MAIPPPIRRLVPDPVLDTPSPVTEVNIELRDWKRLHRALSDERREAAREYITAIIRRDLLLRSATPQEQQAYADRLWHHFREVYDDLRHAEQEDFVRSLARL